MAQAPLSHVSERFHLTPREQEVVQYLVEGLTSKEIAVRLEISPNTVKAFLHSVMITSGRFHAFGCCREGPSPATLSVPANVLELD